MAGRDRTTEADRQLLDELAGRGRTATARQFKRWREAGVLPAPVQESRGRGAGRRSLLYPPGTVDQALVVLELIGQHVPLRHVPIILFSRGFPVPEERLRAAYEEFLDGIQTALGDTPDPADGADQLAQQLRRRLKRYPVGRTWIARAGTYGARRNSTVEDGLAAMVPLMFGLAKPSPEAAAALWRMIGVPDGIQTLLAQELPGVSVPALRAYLTDTSMDQLVHVRTLLARSVGVADRVQRLAVEAGQGAIASGLSDWLQTDELSHALLVLTFGAALPEYLYHEEALEQLAAAVRIAEEGRPDFR